MITYTYMRDDTFGKDVLVRVCRLYGYTREPCGLGGGMLCSGLLCALLTSLHSCECLLRTLRHLFASFLAPRLTTTPLFRNSQLRWVGHYRMR